MAAARALLFLALAAGDPSPTVRPTIKATPRPVAAPTTPRPIAPPTTVRPTVTARPTVKATPRPVAAPTTVRPSAPPTTAKPTVKASPRPSAPPTTARPTVKATPRPVAPPTTIKPTPRPAATPKPTIKETIRPTPRPQQTPGPTLLPTAHFDGVHQTDATIRPAVKLWLEDNAAAVHKYGQIEDWDVSQVTDLSYLFCVRQKEMEGDKHYKHCVLPAYARDFDFDLSRWDTSRVTSMRGTFSFSQNFNQPIGTWRTSSVTDMDEMFSGKVSDQEATGFNQPIEHWDVSAVKTMERMFKDAAVCTRRPRFYTPRRRRRVSPPGEEVVFNQPLSAWRTSSVTSLQETFKDAVSFNQPLPWDVSLVTNAAGIFRDAASFDQDLHWCLATGVNLGLAFSMAPCEATNCGVQVSPNCTSSHEAHHHHDTDRSGPSAGKVFLILFLVLIGAWLLVRCYFIYERSQSQPLVDAMEAEARDCYRRYSNVASDVVAFVQERWAALMGQEDAGEGPAYELLDGGNSPDGL